MVYIVKVDFSALGTYTYDNFDFISTLKTILYIKKNFKRLFFRMFNKQLLHRPCDTEIKW